MRLAIREGADVQGTSHQELQRLAKTVTDQHAASAATLRRLDERITARARVTSLARAEKRLGEEIETVRKGTVDLEQKQQRQQEEILEALVQSSATQDALAARIAALERVHGPPPVAGTAHVTPPSGSGQLAAAVGRPGQPDAGLAEAISALAAAIPLVGTGKRAPVPTEPPTKYAIHDVRSWPLLIAEAGIIGAETKIRMDLGVMSATAKGSHSFSLLWKWVVATLASCPESLSEEQLELGQQLLRDTRVAAAGASFSDVSKAMSKTDWGEDELGRVLAIASRTDGRVRSNNSKLTCWYCSKPGHSAHACRARIAAGAEVPKQAPKKPDQPSPTKPRQGGDKGTH
jgi:hypothetical protein